jgi:siroheme synthase-like protein
MPARPYLPVALNPRGRSAIIVGGGEPAYFKVGYLTEFGLATSVLASPDWEFDERLAEAARAGAITLLREPYTPDHLHGHWLAVISTGDRTRDHAIAADAQARHMLVNVVDDPEHCDFFAAGYVKRGPVSIAVSTGGVSAGFSAALTDRLAGLFGPELEEHVEHYRAWRALVRASLDDAHDRERLWRQLRAAGLYDVLRRDGPEAARALIEARVAEFTATHD